MDMPETPPRSSLQQAFARLRDELQACIIGQPKLVDCLLVALLADGHLLVEGAPGLAKTTAVKALAARIEADFHRVQFTPDLLPADLTGTDVLRPQTGEFEFEPGPLFHNMVLADGHLLVEGAPGLAKTTAIKELAARIEGDFHRVQFTPDLLPADLTGTDVLRPQTGEFEFEPGP
ncbi:MAG TPA: AAA family ATPase, partial [Rhodanobacter sp.]